MRRARLVTSLLITAVNIEGKLAKEEIAVAIAIGQTENREFLEINTVHTQSSRSVRTDR